MSKKTKNGTGLSSHAFDTDKKYVGIDFSGIDKRSNQCYRNDSSIFFYAANSYLLSFYVLSQQIEKSFEAENRKEVERLILPYYFNFRHYLELELKALIIALTNEAPQIIHDLDILWKTFYRNLNDLTYESNMVSKFHCTQDLFDKQKSKILCILQSAEVLLKDYLGQEPNVEYYRFIFDKNMELKNSIIELDYPFTDKKLKELAKRFTEIKICLREIVYLYFTT